MAVEKWIGCVTPRRAEALEWAREARGRYGCKANIRARTVRADGVELLVWVVVVALCAKGGDER